jgi:DNA replication protein DnaC
MTGGVLIAAKPAERNIDQADVSINLNHELELFYRRVVIGLGFSQGMLEIESVMKSDALIRDYCDEALYNSGRGLFIFGKPGAGKSSSLAYLTYRMVKSFGVAVVAKNPEWIDYWTTPSRGKIEYLTAYDLDGILNCRAGNKAIEYLKRYTRVKYLIIDDIDRLMLNDSSARRLENIIERRHVNNLATIISSEEPLDSLKYRRGYNRIAARLALMTQSIEIEGEPIEYELPLMA